MPRGKADRKKRFLSALFLLEHFIQGVDKCWKSAYFLSNRIFDI